MNRKTAFYLLTDAHYVSPRKWVEGAPFTRRERSDQIALKATPRILDAFLNKILADRETDTVVFTGDNIDGGDVLSHTEFRQRLQTLTAAGKKVYVTTATHDYCGDGEDENTFRACRYTENGTEPIPFLRKGDLLDFYYDYGPRQACSVHRGSGSYVVPLGVGVRLIVICDNGNGHSYCGLFEDGMLWLLREMRAAREAGDLVLLATHHPVLPPWDVFRHMAEHEMYGGYRDLQNMMCEENVRVVFTGHTHVQNIRKYTDEKGRWFLDISTIALANAAGKMRKVIVDAESGVCEVESIGIETLPGQHGKSAYEMLYPLNFPGILEKLLPLGAHDFDAFLQLADGFLPTDTLRAHRRAITAGCRKLETMKLSAAAKFGGVWRAMTEKQRAQAKEERLADGIGEVLRHIFSGNAPYTPDTVEYAALHGAAQRLDTIVRKLRIGAICKCIPPASSLPRMLDDFLYNTRTGDDDAIRFELR